MGECKHEIMNAELISVSVCEECCKTKQAIDYERLTTECDRLKDEKRVLESKVGELRARMTEIKTQARVYKKSMEHTKEACKEIKAEKEQWKSIADDLVDIKRKADGRDSTCANQGQAMDGYSELANYRAIIDRIKVMKGKP